MKDKIVDKKIVILFLIMIIMIVFMIVFMSKQNKTLQEKLNMETGDVLSLINKKQKEIRDFLDDDNSLFNENLIEIFKKLDLVSYLDLPLEITARGNDYPFGDGEGE